MCSAVYNCVGVVKRHLCLVAAIGFGRLPWFSFFLTRAFGFFAAMARIRIIAVERLVPPAIFSIPCGNHDFCCNLPAALAGRPGAHSASRSRTSGTTALLELPDMRTRRA